MHCSSNQSPPLVLLMNVDAVLLQHTEIQGGAEIMNVEHVP